MAHEEDKDEERDDLLPGECNDDDGTITKGDNLPITDIPGESLGDEGGTISTGEFSDGPEFSLGVALDVVPDEDFDDGVSGPGGGNVLLRRSLRFVRGTSSECL